MRSSLRLALSVGLALGMASAGAQADVWDIQTDNDNSTATENELMHGSDELHDLGALPGPLSDQDWFRLSQKAFSSYEAAADATSGDIGATLNLERIASDGTTVAQSSAAVGVGYSRSLRWANDTAAPVDDEYVRVTSGSTAPRTVGRTTSTGSGSTRRRWPCHASTTRAARTPCSCCITPRPTPSPATSTSGAPPGALIAPSPFTLVPRQLLVLNGDGGPGDRSGR